MNTPPTNKIKKFSEKRNGYFVNKADALVTLLHYTLILLVEREDC